MRPPGRYVVGCGLEDIQIFYVGYLSFPGVDLPLSIKDDTTAALVTRLAQERGITKRAAVRLAVEAELDRAARAVPLAERFAALRRQHPLPPATGDLADKAFFDTSSGGM